MEIDVNLPDHKLSIFVLFYSRQSKRFILIQKFDSSSLDEALVVISSDKLSLVESQWTLFSIRLCLSWKNNTQIVSTLMDIL